jgi:hypothetical protein
MTRLRLALLATLALLVCAGGAPAQSGPAPLRVLFVGNSLTATNDLPAVVARIARSHGRSLEYRTVAFGGYALEDHWAQGDARAALGSGKWDVIVMQQGPSALPESQSNLRAWAIRWADEAARFGTRTALLTVWPESYRRGALVDVIASYRRAAEASGAMLLPAGDAWRLAWRCAPRLALYGPDGFHPSELGTLAAALVVYGRLFKASLVEPRASSRTRLLEKAAARSLGRRILRPCAA